MRKLTLIALVVLLVACTTSSTFDVVITDDNHVTVWDSSGRGYSIPMEDVTIHGMENLPEPTATPKVRPTPTPWPTPAPIPTPVPGTVIDINDEWSNPFVISQYEEMRVSITVNLDTLSFRHAGGWRNDGGVYVKCLFPETLTENDRLLMTRLVRHDPATFVGRLEYNDSDNRYELLDCLASPVG